MRYFYLIDENAMNDYAVCFSSKKAMIEHAKRYCFAWYYTTNKKDIPPRIKTIIGNGICKDYHKKNDVLVIKDSLKDRRK